MTEQRMKVALPIPLWRALAQVVGVTGIARDGLIAEAVASYLISRGALSPDEINNLKPKKTHGRIADHNRKDK